MSGYSHTITQGDTLTPLTVELQQKDSTGELTAVDLTGRTVKFKMVNDIGTSVVTETTTGVTTTSASDGQVQIDFQSAWVATAGQYWGWVVVYSGSEKDTFPHDGRGLSIVIVPSEPPA